MAGSIYKRPESVLVIVYSAAAEVLMLQRHQPPGYWQSVTGSLKPGEAPLAAARRELREETGLELELMDCHATNTFPIHPAWRERYAPDTTTNLEHVFRAQCSTRANIAINPREHRAYRWLSREAAARLAGSWTNRDAILALVPAG